MKTQPIGLASGFAMRSITSDFDYIQLGSFDQMRIVLLQFNEKIGRNKLLIVTQSY
jgi:hypothetical protein